MKKIFFCLFVLVESCFASAWFEGSALFWKPWENALVVTNKPSDIFTTDDFTLMPVIHPHFEWSWGYRLSGGYLFSCWELSANWTHYTSHLSQDRSIDQTSFLGMFPIWSDLDSLPGDFIFQSHLQWKFLINLLDAQCSYLIPYRSFDFIPYLGLRSAWVKQYGNIQYRGGIFLIGIIEPGISLEGTDFIQLKNNYWGLGPRVGIAPLWHIGRGFSLNGNVAISGLYGSFHLIQKETYLDTTRFFYDKNINRFCWATDFQAGIEWRISRCNRYALTLKTEWEYHIFFHQFILNNDLTPNNRNLSTQGVTFSAKVDF